MVQEDNVDRRKALVLDELLRLGVEEAVAAAKADAAIAEGFRNRLEADPQQAYSALRVPVLAVFGARDTQIWPIWSADALRSTFRSSGLTSCILVFDELNHLLQTAQTGMPDEYGTIEENVAAPVLAAVGDWIHHIPTVGPECPEP